MQTARKRGSAGVPGGPARGLSTEADAAIEVDGRTAEPRRGGAWPECVAFLRQLRDHADELAALLDARVRRREGAEH
jgi:hypothetical protein